MAEASPEVQNLARLLMQAGPDPQRIGWSTPRPPKPSDDPRVADFIRRSTGPQGLVNEDGTPADPQRSEIAQLLMGVRDRIPEGNGALSILNMLRSALERSANLQDVVGGYRDPQSVNPLDLVPMMAPGAVMASRARSAAPSFKAYHGSPHDFDRFSMDKIGSGEGAQAFGHGLYFADEEAVARGYRDKLSGDEPGHMYKVRIKADPNDFLDWDRPLNRQGLRVRDALEPFLREMDSRYHAQSARVDSLENATPLMRLSMQRGLDHTRVTPDSTGRELLTRGFPDSDKSAVAATLKEAGIPGIRYDDAMSRGGWGGTRNTVVFDDKLIEIIRKYGLAGALAAGGLAASGRPSEASP